MDIIGLLILLGFGWLVGVVALTLYTLHMLTHPPRRTYSYAVAKQLPSNPGEVRLTLDGAERLLTFEEWSFSSGRIDHPVWDVRGLVASGATIILTHGWGDSRVVMLQRVTHLAKHAARVIVWDIPAQGDSPATRGFTLGAREHTHLRALVDVVVASGTAAGGIVLYGFSLGAGISIVCAAAGASVGAVIAEAPYCVPITPARNVMKQAGLPHAVTLPLAMLMLGMRLGYGASWMRTRGAGGFDRREHAAKLRVPLLLLHGVDDAVCPVADSREIAAACGRAQLVEIPGGRHLDLWTEEDHAAKCEAAVASFLGGIRGAGV